MSAASEEQAIRYPGDVLDALAYIEVPGAARLDRLRADAVLAVDLIEDARRRRLGVGAVSRLHLLDTLMKLPVGEAVSVEGLLERDRRRVAAVSPGVVECSERGLVRWLRPVIEVVMVRIAIGDWAARLRQATSFARFAPALVMVDRPPSNEQMLQADYFASVLLTLGSSTSGRARRNPRSRRWTGCSASALTKPGSAAQQALGQHPVVECHKLTQHGVELAEGGLGA